MGFNLPLGYGAVVTLDPKTGKTQHYEFGRYTDKECGNFSIEIAQTSTWPEVYIGVGAGIGPEVKIPYTPSVSFPVF